MKKEVIEMLINNFGSEEVKFRAKLRITLNNVLVDGVMYILKTLPYYFLTNVNFSMSSL